MISFCSLSWLSKGGFAILDQGFFAGANFILNILLVRWLEPAQYGAFTLAYSVFLLIGAFHTAILTEPMMVFGAGKYAKHFEKYLGILIYGHFSLMLFIGLLLTAVAFILGRFYLPEVQWALLGSAVSGPIVLLLWLMRRAFYARLQPALAAVGGGFYLVLLLGATYFLWIGSRLSQTTAFLAMGISAFLVSLAFIYHLRVQWIMAGNPTPAMVASDHWRYGRWATGTQLINWIPGNIYYLLLPVWLPLYDIAAIKALMNVLLPASFILMSLSTLLLPFLSRIVSKEGVSAARFHLRKILALYITITSIYFISLFLFGKYFLEIVYRNAYHEFYALIPYLSIIPIPVSLIMSFGLLHRAMQRADRAFINYLPYTSSCALIGVSAGVFFSIKGVIFGVAISSILGAIISFIIFQKCLSEDSL